MQKLIHLCVLTVASTVWIASAKPYPEFDLSTLLTPDQQSGGAEFHFDETERIFNALSEHAADYPTQFDNDADKQRAKQDVTQLAVLLVGLQKMGIVKQNSSEYTAINLRLARLAWMAHNMDIPNSAEAADQTYKKLIEQSKGKEQLAFKEEYGRFLSSTGQTTVAEPYLRAAVDGGLKQARFPLAMNLIAQNKLKESKTLLQAYVKDNPQNKNAANILEALKAGKIEIKEAPLKQ